MYSHVNNLTVEDIEQVLSELLLHTPEEIEVYHMAKHPAGAGHYRMETILMLNGEQLTLNATTSDMQLIDAWDEEPEYFLEHDWYEDAEDVKAQAFYFIINNNQSKIEDWLEEVD